MLSTDLVAEVVAYAVVASGVLRPFVIETNGLVRFFLTAWRSLPLLELVSQRHDALNPLWRRCRRLLLVGALLVVQQVRVRDGPSLLQSVGQIDVVDGLEVVHLVQLEAVQVVDGPAELDLVAAYDLRVVAFKELILGHWPKDF